MSQESVDLVLAGIEAWNKGDMAMLHDLFQPDVIGRAPEDWPEPGPFVGREAVMRQWKQMREVFDVDALEPISDFTDVGDRVAVRVIWHAAGRGPVSNLEMTDIFTVRNGKIFGIDVCWDHAEALEALSLSEQDAHTDS
jgi:ketosteroid isomerase-like protein